MYVCSISYIERSYKYYVDNPLPTCTFISGFPWEEQRLAAEWHCQCASGESHGPRQGSHWSTTVHGLSMAYGLSQSHRSLRLQVSIPISVVFAHSLKHHFRFGAQESWWTAQGKVGKSFCAVQISSRFIPHIVTSRLLVSAFDTSVRHTLCWILILTNYKMQYKDTGFDFPPWISELYKGIVLKYWKISSTGIYLEGGEPGDFPPWPATSPTPQKISNYHNYLFLFVNVVSEATRSSLRCHKFQNFLGEYAPRPP